MDIFISHITQDSKIAITLKEWIDTTLLGNFEVFVSSDSESIPSGTRWLDEISKALDECKVMLILCSPESIKRHWISFEAGCGWTRRIPVIPICYNGLVKSQLPQPIGALQALDFDQKFPEKLFQALIEHLGLSKMPRISFDEMYRELYETIGSIPKLTPQIKKKDEASKSDAQELSEEEIEILSYLAKHNKGIMSNFIRGSLKMNHQRLEYFLEKLEQEEYIYCSFAIGDPSEYGLEQRGRELLIKKGII